MSKHIIFVRHAKSSWTDLSMRDFDRPLDDRGLRDAPNMARRLVDAGYRPTSFISSSALRAKQTANFFGNVFEMPIQFSESLYHAPPPAYMHEINLLSESIETCILFGHNPGMTDIANLVELGCVDDLPTCGIIITKVAQDLEWDNVDWKDLTLIKIMTPKSKE